MKTNAKFVCSECGFETGRWLGKCVSCGAWNTLVEEAAPKISGARSQKAAAAVSLSGVSPQGRERIMTKIGELDRVLGGGIVKGSLILVGGEPGIGKSTLLLQICEALGGVGNVLYASGEESEAQIKLRADRLKIKTPNLYLVSETDLDKIMGTLSQLKPAVLIIDSIQTMFVSAASSAPGSVSQVREATAELMRYAKQSDTAVFIVGHVTKEGAIAGPRVLEHMVDCVLYFEGERHQSYRILRAVKNRFGSTNEIGVFDMDDSGLKEVKNPSAALLEGRPEKTPGSAVVCAMEGTRPILAEVQALVAPTGFGIPRRTTTGIDYNRVTMLIAVLEKRLRLNMQNQDAYVNVVGGLKIDETAADLSVCAAIASSFKSVSIPDDMIFLGEVGLTGEVRAISHAARRLGEAAKLGFKTCVLPAGNAAAAKGINGIKALPAKTLKQALGYIKQGGNGE